MSDWIEYKNEKGQTVYFNKTVSSTYEVMHFLDWHYKPGETWIKTIDFDLETESSAVDSAWIVISASILWGFCRKL